MNATSHNSPTCYPPGIAARSRMAQVRRHRMQKRTLDLAVTVPLLVFTMPLWLLIALCIRCTSRGPAIYRQRRIGQNGREFVLLKFRTMYLTSDDAHRSYTARWILGGDQALQPGGAFKLVHDARITRVGAWLRRFSLDELPQLLNVLRGDMSLVGPRPALAYEIQHYQPWQLRRLDTLPGLTGLWQVSGRNRLGFDQMIALDLQYIRRWSLRHDLAILIRTIPAVVLGTGH